MTLSGRIPLPSGSDGAPVLRLRLLATADLHANLFPFDYYRDRRDCSVGLAQAAHVIDSLRAGHPNTLLFDNGDLLQGAPLADAALEEILPRGRTHPMIAAMNMLGYDAATLGNHDFDFGMPALERMLAQVRHDIVLSNATRTAGPDLWRTHALLRREMSDETGTSHTVSIGVIGVMPPQTMCWNGDILEGELAVEDMLAAVRREAALLRDADADLVVVLAHSGLGPRAVARGAENAAQAIAALPGIDAVVAGHTHVVFPNAETRHPARGDTAPIVQPGARGSHVGVIDLTLHRPAAVPVAAEGAAGVLVQPDARATEHSWLLSEATSAVRTVPTAPGVARAALRETLRRYPDLRRQIKHDHRATRALTTQPLGRTAVPLHSYLSMVGPCRSLSLIAEAQRAVAVEALAGHADLQGLPLISAVAPFRAGGDAGCDNYTDIPAGPLLMRHAADLYPYPNGLAVLRVTGAIVMDWLERVAAAFHTITPRGAGAAPQSLRDRAFACYNFDCLAGLRYAFDLSVPARTTADGETDLGGPGRVRDLRLACGTPVGPDDRLLVATNTYRAHGGGGFCAARQGEIVLRSGRMMREVLSAHMASAPEALCPEPLETWRLAPMGGTPVLFEVGPGLLDHPGDIAALGLTPAGRTPEGCENFLRHI